MDVVERSWPFPKHHFFCIQCLNFWSVYIWCFALKTSTSFSSPKSNIKWPTCGQMRFTGALTRHSNGEDPHICTPRSGWWNRAGIYDNIIITTQYFEIPCLRPQFTNESKIINNYPIDIYIYNYMNLYVFILWKYPHTSHLTWRPKHTNRPKPWLAPITCCFNKANLV